MSEQGMYLSPLVIYKKAAYTAVNVSNIIPAYGDLVLGYNDGTNFYITDRLEDIPQEKFINPLNKFGIDTNNDLIDEDKYLSNGDLIIGLLYDVICARASEMANITLFKSENLLRLVGANLQTYTSAYSLNSIGNSLVFKMFNSNFTSESIKIFGSQDGDNIHIVVQDPDTLAGLADVHIGSNGNVDINTTTSVSIKKKSKIKNPIVKKIVLAPKGLNKRNFKLDSLNTDGYNLSDTNEEAANEQDNITNLIKKGYEFNEIPQTTDPFGDDAIFKIRDDGSIILKSSGGAFIELTSTGKARVSAPNGLMIDSGNEATVLAKHVDIRSKNDINLTSDTDNIRIYANNDILFKSNNLQMEANNNIKQRAQNALITFASNEVLISSNKTTIKALPSQLWLDGIDFSPGQYILGVPAATIVSIPGVFPSAFDSEATPVIRFMFDDKNRIKNNILYESDWMSDKKQVWVLNDTSVIENATSPYPGSDVIVRGYDDVADVFAAGLWKVGD